MKAYRTSVGTRAVAFRVEFLLTEADMAAALASQFTRHVGPLPELSFREARLHIHQSLWADGGIGNDDAEWPRNVQKWAEQTVRRLFGPALDAVT